jgi:hypothetical protein
LMGLRHGVVVLVGSIAIAHAVMPANAECPTLRIDDEFKRSTAVFVGRAIALAMLTWRCGASNGPRGHLEAKGA